VEKTQCIERKKESMINGQFEMFSFHSLNEARGVVFVEIIKYIMTLPKRKKTSK
jgi:hypothetical protein